MLLSPVGLLALGLIALYLSRPLLSKSSFDWWSMHFWGKPADNFYYIYNRYYQGAGSLVMAIMLITLGAGLLLKTSDLILSSLFLIEGLIISFIGGAMYFNKSLPLIFLNLTWTSENQTLDIKCITGTFLVVGLLLIFTAYMFRPFNFYF